MVTRAGYRANIQYEWDDTNQETVASGAALQFDDDFIGAGHTAGIPAAGSPAAGYPWVKKITGSGPPTAGLVTNSSGGIMQAALVATSEIEEASLYFNDSLCIDTTKFGEIEWRAQLAVAPSLAGVQAAIGLGSAWVGGPLNLARYMLFYWSASGALMIGAKDGVALNYSAAAAQPGGSAITSDANMHVFSIRWENAADVQFCYDGNRVNPVGSIVWGASGANAILQPWATVYKTASAGLATLNLDKVDFFSGR